MNSLIDFDEFVELGGYSGIEYTNLENEKIYEYLGEEDYLYYNVFIPYNNDYKFSYKTTGISSIVVRFYDEQKNNISNEVQEIVQNGIIDCVAAGKPKEQMITRLMKDMSSGYSQADRIARTELSYV